MPGNEKAAEGAHAPAEYAGDRDMERFWAEAVPAREPLMQRWYVPALLLLVILSIPWYLRSGEIGRIVGGLPLWVWTALGCSVGVAALTALAILGFWRDRDSDSD